MTENGQPERAFDRLDIHPRLKDALAEFLPYHFMYSAQAEAVARALDGSSVLAAIPTAGGKSVIGFIAMLNNALMQGKKGMYIVPFKSLAAEKKKDLKELCTRLGLRVEVMTGDRSDQRAVPEGADIVLATAEKADSLMRHQDRWFAGLGTVVADEVHTVSDSTRGPTYESVLTQLHEHMPDLQIIALSGTVPNVKEMSAWLGAVPVTGEVRPAKLRTGVFSHTAGGIRFDDGTGTDLKTDSTVRREVFKEIAGRALKKGEQVLTFVSSRGRCTELAVLAAAGQDLIGDDKHRMSEQEIRDVLSGYPDGSGEADEAEKARQAAEYGALEEALRKGYGFHHAGFNPKQREIIEKAYKKGQLRMLVASPTLAAGVNLPADTVIVYDTQRYDAENDVYIDLTPAEIKQMCGRAGRFGSEGQAVILPRIHRSETKATEVTPGMIEKKYIYAPPEPVVSALGDRKNMRAQVLALISNGERDIGKLTGAVAGSLWGRTAPEKVVSAVQEAVSSLAQDRLIMTDPGHTVFGCTGFGAVAARLCISPDTAVTLLKACESQGTMRNMSPEGRDMYMACAIAMADEMSGIQVREDSDEQMRWAEEESGWPTMREKLPADWPADADGSRIPGDRFRTAILLARMLDSDPGELNQWARSLGVDAGDLYEKRNLAKWLAHSAAAIANVTDQPNILLRTVEPRLIDKAGWDRGDLGRILGAMSLDGDMEDEQEMRMIRQLAGTLNDSAAMLDPSKAEFMDEQFPEVSRYAPVEDGDTGWGSDLRFLHLPNPAPVRRVPAVPEPDLGLDWDRMTEAFALKEGKKHGMTFDEKMYAKLVAESKTEVNASIDRIIKGQPQTETEESLCRWYAQQQAAVPGADDMIRATLEDALLRAARSRKILQRVSKAVYGSSDRADPGELKQRAEAALDADRQRTEAQEKEMQEYYAQRRTNISNMQRAYGLTPYVEKDPLLMPEQKDEPAPIYQVTGYKADELPARTFLHRVHIDPPAEGDSKGRYGFTGPDTQSFNGYSTINQTYEQMVRGNIDRLRGGQPLWNKLADGIAVVTVSDDMPPEKIAAFLRGFWGDRSSKYQTSQYGGIAATSDTALAESLRPWFGPETEFVVPATEGSSYPEWEQPADGHTLSDSKSPDLRWKLISSEDLARNAVIPDLRERGVGFQCKILGKTTALRRAPSALLGVEHICAGDPRAEAVMAELSGYQGAIVCGMPQVNSGLREAMLARADRMVIVIPSDSLNPTNKAFVKAISDAGGCVLVSNRNNNFEDSTYLQAALANRIRVAACRNPHTDPTASAVFAANWTNDKDLLPGNEEYRRACGLNRTGSYVPGSMLGAELTLTLENLGKSPDIIKQFAEYYKYDANTAFAKAKAQLGTSFDQAHQEALERLGSMAEYGIRPLTIFDSGFDRRWADNDADPKVQYTVLGNTELLGSKRYSVDGSDVLFDSNDNYKTLRVGDHPYSRGVGSCMQLLTSGVFDGVMTTAAHSSGARAANEAIYRTGSNQIRYLDIPIEDLMELGGPDSALMWYLRNKKFADPEEEDRLRAENKDLSSLTPEENKLLYRLNLVQEDGTIDPRTIYGMERKVTSDENGEERYEYTEGAGMRAFTKLCMDLDKKREMVLDEARQMGRPAPTVMTVTEGSKKYRLPLHPTYTYRDILMDSIALNNARSGSGHTLLIAPTAYRTKRVADGYEWTPAQDQSDTMVASQRDGGYLSVGAANNRHPEVNADKVYLFPVSRENRFLGGGDLGHLRYGGKVHIFREYDESSPEIQVPRGKMDAASWLEFNGESLQPEEAPAPTDPKPEPAPEAEPDQVQ